MRLLIVTAHADDETLGMSALLTKHAAECLLLHVTDSAPRNLAYARKAGFESRAAYAEARRRELLEAMSLAAIGPRQCLECNVADQDAVREIPLIIRRTAELILQWRPERIYTHAYEGGHPDHDAVAAGVHRVAGETPVWEFAGYHLRDGVYETMRFLPGSVEEETLILDSVQQKQKRAMLGCFRSQREVLERFPVEAERFRPTPRYDFTAPPHPGTLYYETRDLGWSAREWMVELRRSWAKN